MDSESGLWSLGDARARPSGRIRTLAFTNRQALRLTILSPISDLVLMQTHRGTSRGAHACGRLWTALGEWALQGSNLRPLDYESTALTD